MTVELRTERLVLRPWRVGEASVQRELWLERDPRVPARRRIDEEGRPTLAEFEEAIRSARPEGSQLLAVVRLDEGDVVGYCGLGDSGHGPDEPELAYELLRRVWGRGYATEAARAVVAWARGELGHRRLWATVWEWNVESRRVLDKLGFVEVGREDGSHGDNLTTALEL